MHNQTMNSENMTQGNQSEQSTWQEHETWPRQTTK